MKLLALDTSTPHCTLAIDVDGVCREDNHMASNNHGDFILSTVESLLHQSQLKLTNLDAIACGIGPGSFTGLRLAVSVAQGLALSANLPLIPVPSLAILAQEAFVLFGAKKIISAIDARMGQVYWQLFSVKEDTCLVEAQGLPQLSSPEDCLQHITEDRFAFGDAFRVYPQMLNTQDAFQEELNLFPKAKYMLMLGKKAYIQRETLKADELMPMYVRDKVTN